MDSIKDEEKKVVEELRRRNINTMTPKTLEDICLFYRFSKARDFNLGQAETMLRKHITWRKEMKVDTILTDYEPPEVFLKYVPVSFACFDKFGCAVMFHDIGRADLNGLLHAATKMEILMYTVYFVEQSRERVIKREGNGKERFKLGKPILAPIYDLDELTHSNAVNMKILQILIQIVLTVIENYPESLRTITVINAPFYFAWMYAALKPLLPSTVIEKVKIYGSDGWKEALLENIEADDLPAYLGGNRTDPNGNPLCEKSILRGKLIPKNYYMQKGKTNFALESDVKKLTLLPFSKEEMTFKVKEENSILEWEFEIKSKGIDFSLLFRKGSPEDIELVEIIPKQRIDTTIGPEKGSFRCDKAGHYTIVFDNSYSWIHSKEVHYRIGIKSTNCKESVESIGYQKIKLK